MRLTVSGASRYWPVTDDTRTATFSLALDATTLENGCLNFVAGSHKEEKLRDHRPYAQDLKVRLACSLAAVQPLPPCTASRHSPHPRCGSWYRWPGHWRRGGLHARRRTCAGGVTEGRRRDHCGADPSRRRQHPQREGAARVGRELHGGVAPHLCVRVPKQGHHRVGARARVHAQVGAVGCGIGSEASEMLVAVATAHTLLIRCPRACLVRVRFCSHNDDFNWDQCVGVAGCACVLAVAAVA